MISYTYSNDYPTIQRLQGGILYPFNIEMVSIPDIGDQYKFKYLKFADNGEDIRDYAKFTAAYKAKIDELIAADVDIQKESSKHVAWVAKAKHLPSKLLEKLKISKEELPEKVKLK